eukprot:6185746-Pleurochrysis_carterae.AAC.2
MSSDTRLESPPKSASRAKIPHENAKMTMRPTAGPSHRDSPKRSRAVSGRGGGASFELRRAR